MVALYDDKDLAVAEVMKLLVRAAHVRQKRDRVGGRRFLEQHRIVGGDKPGRRIADQGRPWVFSDELTHKRRVAACVARVGPHDAQATAEQPGIAGAIQR